MSRTKTKVKRIILGILTTFILFVVVVIANLIIVNRIESIVSMGQPIESYRESNSALLVIDIQEATTGDISMYPSFKKNSEDLITNVNQIADNFRIQNMPVVYIRSEITNPIINMLNSSYAKGHPGAEFDKRLKTATGIEVVKKGKDSFRKTNLDSILIHHKVNELYIVGLDAAECVNATVEAAQNRKYVVNIIEEAVLSKSQERKDSMLAIFSARGIRVIPIDSLFKMK